jgi:ABC-type glycerol-3-phosphate transport system substrate-binding protein
LITAGTVAKGITLRFHSRTGSEADTLNERLPEFADKTGIEVKPEQFPGGEYYQKMQTLIAGGQMGDVIWMSSTVGMPIWGATGIIQPIDDFISQEKFDLGQYYKAAVDQLIYQGKTYALPFKLQPGQMGLYYNSNAFKEASVKEPTLTTTFDELIQLSKELHKGSGDRVERFGFLPWIFTADNTGGFQMTAHYARAWGAELMDAEGKKALMTEQKFKDAIIWVNDVIFKHKIAPSAKQVTGDPDQMFVAGMGAMYQSGSWTKSVQTRIKDNKFEVKATLMPKGPGGKRGSMAIADSIGINAKAKNPKEAWELTKFLCDQETGIRLGEGRGGASGTSGGRKDVFESERLKKNPLHPIWIEAVGVAEAPRLPGNFRTVEFATALWQKMNALWIGDEQPTEKFFQELNAACQQVLDQPRP